MKKIISIIFLAVLILMLNLLSCKDESSLPVKKWTFLLYDDADFSNAFDPLSVYPDFEASTFSRLVSSNESINYIVLRDRADDQACYYKVDESNNLRLLKKLGEQNMGRAATLGNFIKYAKENFPAERYIVALYDHGSGWRGACTDVTDGNDMLTAYEIDFALSSSGGVDFLLFTAPCLMGSIETAYQVRNSCSYYIGSEDLSGFILWINMISSFDNYIKKNPDCLSEDLAKKIIELHSEYINDYPTMTMSAVRTSYLKDFTQSMDDVFKYYCEHINDFKNFTQGKLKRYYYDFCDLKGLLIELRSMESNTEIQNALSKAIEQFDKCIVANCYGKSNIGSNGLNIYFPAKRYTDEIYYLPYADNLDFRQSSWALLIQKLLSKEATVKNNPLQNLVNRDCLLLLNK